MEDNVLETLLFDEKQSYPEKFNRFRRQNNNASITSLSIFVIRHWKKDSLGKLIRLMEESCYFDDSELSCYFFKVLCETYKSENPVMKEKIRAVIRESCFFIDPEYLNEIDSIFDVRIDVNTVVDYCFYLALLGKYKKVTILIMNFDLLVQGI